MFQAAGITGYAAETVSENAIEELVSFEETESEIISFESDYHSFYSQL